MVMKSPIVVRSIFTGNSNLVDLCQSKQMPVNINKNYSP